MAEDEIRKHTKAVYNAWNNPELEWKHKLKEILIEILIIVFAVSISIWFHNWSESHKDRKEEREFLTGLKTDLQADLKEMKGDTSAYNTILDGTLYFREVGAGERLSYDSLNRYGWIFFASVRKQARTSRFEALKGSGKLDVIENKLLLRNIISFYQEIIPTIISADQQFTAYNQNKVGTYLDAHAKLDTANNITNWLELFRNPEFRMALFRINTISENINAYVAGINMCDEIMRQIDEELK